LVVVGENEPGFALLKEEAGLDLFLTRWEQSGEAMVLKI
jgi:hypothetical protein